MWVMPPRHTSTCNKKQGIRMDVLFQSGAGYEARTRSPASHELPAAIRRNPASPLIGCALRARVEAARSLHLTKKQGIRMDVLFQSGAGYEARTRSPASHELRSAIRRNPTSPLIKNALRAWVSVSSSFRLTKKSGHPNRMSGFTLERATRLELATSTLARWRSTR